MSRIIGIDLGSTASEVAIIENGKPIVLVNDEGQRITPSVISFNKDGERNVGALAKRQAIVNPKGTVNLIKRFMGGTYDEVKDNITHIQYDVIEKRGYPLIVINDKEYTPEELSAMILLKMKKIAEDYLQEEILDAVITVPAYFNDAQREATKKAGEIAGLNVRRIIAEPTAAILASNIDMEKGGKYMVVDYGGSTTDFSIAEISDGVVEILASNGDVYCGGSDIDKIISQYIIDEFNKKENFDLSKDSMAMSRIIDSAEKAKMELSSASSTEINLPYITAINGMPKHLVLTLTRSKFEELIDTEITKVINLGRDAIKKASLTPDELDGILLVGGSTRIPKLQNELTNAFNIQLLKNVNVDEIVAMGAAVQGAIINGEKKDVLLLDVTPLSLGINTLGGIMTPVIEANTTIPCKRNQYFTTAEDNQPAVTLQIVQGNRPMVEDNKIIGEFTLDGIAPAPRGVPKINVVFDIDSNGILSVSATDDGTGKEQHITVQSRGSLNDSDIERMKKEAEEYAEEDKKRKELIETFNEAQSYCFNVEKSINNFGDELTEELKEPITVGIKELREAIDNKDIDKVKELRKNLESIWNPISETIYKNKEESQENGTDMNNNASNPFNGFDPTNGKNPFNGFGPTNGGNPFNKI